MEYAGGGKPNQPLKPGDDRIRPVADLIFEIMGEVRRPCMVAETSGLYGGRPTGSTTSYASVSPR